MPSLCRTRCTAGCFAPSRSSFRGAAALERAQWTYLAAVVVVGYLVLPWYFISTGVYLNWPPVHTPDQVVRLFIGVNAVGIWDELFFICIVFTLYRRHFKLWQANLLQAMIFVSFLWELGYQSWGPLLTIPFALVQGAIFQLTKNLAYVRNRAPVVRPGGVLGADPRAQSCLAAHLHHRLGALVSPSVPSPVPFGSVNGEPG